MSDGAAAAAEAAAAAQPGVCHGIFDDLDLTLDTFDEAQFGGPGGGGAFMAALANLADSEPVADPEPAWPSLFPAPANVSFYDRRAVRAEIQFCGENAEFLWAPGAIEIPPEKLQLMKAGAMTHDIYEQPVGDAAGDTDAASSAFGAATAASVAAHVLGGNGHAAQPPSAAAAAAASAADAALAADATMGSVDATVGTHDSLMDLLVQEGLAPAQPSTITADEEMAAKLIHNPTRFIPPRGFFIVVVHAEGPDSEPFGIMEAYDFTTPAFVLGPATQQERDAATHVQPDKKRCFTWLEHVTGSEEQQGAGAAAAAAAAVGDEDMTQHADCSGDAHPPRTKFSRSAEDGSAVGTADGHARVGVTPSTDNFAWPVDTANETESWTNQLVRDGFWVSIKREKATGFVSGVRIGFPFGSLIIRAKINALFA